MTGTSAVMMGGQMPLQDYEGGCHCGRVRFRVTGDLARVTDCNCSICTKKGFLHLIVAPDAFELISGKRCADHLPVQHRHGAPYLLRHLRHPSVLRSALRSG